MKVTPTEYFTYILTNYKKTVLYTGVTNDLEQRIIEHYLDRGLNTSFTSKYHVYYLLYYETFDYIDDAIAREKEIKCWSREKKEALITSINPTLKILNDELFDEWPPKNAFHRRDI